MFTRQQRNLASRRAVAVATALSGALMLGPVLSAQAASPLPTTAVAASVEGTGVVINEAYLSGGSANAAYATKFVELYNPGASPVDLTGWSLQYRSASGTGASSSTAPLSGTIAAGGYYLVSGGSNGANGAALPAADLVAPGINTSGTTGTLALVAAPGAITLPTGSVVGNPQIVDLLGYGTSNTFETAVAPAPAANNVPQSINRTAFADTDDNAVDFTLSSTVTPQNAASTGPGTEPTPEPTDDPTDEPTDEPTAEPTDEPTDPTTPTVTAIADIQGDGDVSPLVGQTVTTRGVVTATYPSGGFNGLYIQTPGTGGDLDLATHTRSDAIFVYSAAAAEALSVGQYVEITGPVSEYFTLTQVTATSYRVLDEVAEVVKPANVAYPADAAGRETLEGMLVQPAGDFVVADNYSTNYYGSFLLAAGTEPFSQPTDVGRPGSPEAAAVEADVAARAVVLDDGATTNFNATANRSKPLPYLTGGAPARVGAPVTFTQPVILDYRFDAWTFQPTTELTPANAAAVQPATFADTRTPAPEDVGGDVRLATFNVLNYFTTTGDQLTGCTFYTDRAGNRITVNTGCDARGAANAESLQRQETKIVAAINALDADVVSLEEIENSAVFGKDRDAALSDLVDALNTAAGSPVWSFVPSPAAVPADEDVIRTAFIYRSAAVTTTGESTILDDPAFVNAREPLAQTFLPVGADASEAFTVIANHFKSKGSGTGVDADTGDGQGASNASRVNQGTALVAFAATVEAAAGTDRTFLVGDFNSYTQEDPLVVLAEAGYTNLSAGTGEQTYLFGARVGSLDHVFGSPAATAAVSGVDIWNINSVEPLANEYSRYNYNASILYDETPFRSSDHDPIVVGITTAPVPAEPIELNLLGINDFHGRIDANTVAFAGTVEQLRATNPDRTAFLSVGDNIGASLFASSSQGDLPTLDVLDALDLSASAVGNHEFDGGFADLTGRVSDAADWEYLGANVYAKGTSDPALSEYTILDVDGVRVGVIGVVTEETPSLVTPAGIADLDFGDPVEAINRVAAQLGDGDDSNGEADVIVALVHEGAGAGTPDGATIEEEIAAGDAFAKIVTGTDPAVDAIFTGHTHKEYAWDAPVTGTDRTRPIIQTGSYGERIGQITLTLDPQSLDVTGYTVGNVARTTTPAAELVATYPRVAEVKTIVDAALAEAAIIGNQPVGSVTADITTAYRDGVRDDRASESTLGNLVANSLRETLAPAERGGAQIGIVNPGGLRADLLYGADGVITYAEANAVLPFVNNLWSTSLTGAQLVDVLEQQWQPAGSSRPFLNLGLSDNVTYTYTATNAPGERITSVTIDGVALDPAASYRVATFSFLATGGDNFTAFTQGTDARDSGLVDRDAWISYLQANPGLSPDFARQGVQTSALPSAVDAGASVSLDLAKLDLTSLGSPANTSVAAYLVPAGSALDPAATPLATVPVTAGAATVAVTVPTGTAAGTYDLRFVATPSGTTVTVPLTVRAVAPPATLALASDAFSFCLLGRSQVVVYATNLERTTVSITVTTPLGSQTFAKVRPGHTVVATFGRWGAIPAGTATVTATGTVGDQAATTTQQRGYKATRGGLFS